MSAEPGLDRHEWESEWASLEEELEDSPGETLPLVDGLVARMLDSRGFAVDDPVADDGDDPEILAEFRAAREITRRLDSGDDDVGPGDIAAAVNGYRAVYEFLLAERGAP
jgi:hypothetical protein